MSTELTELMKSKIEVLRPKIIDLSRRNPLINTRFGGAYSSQIRVVDELPDVLYYGLSNGRVFQLDPLPRLDEDPKDEQKKEFQNLLSECLLKDEEYINDIEELDLENENYLDLKRKIERALRDRVRKQLGWAPRQIRSEELSLTQHARNNEVSPEYDLPKPEDAHIDGRHDDAKIQTLLLPNDLERLCNRLVSRTKQYESEYGINFFHGAYGFLEWVEKDGDKNCVSPLVISNVKISGKNSKDGRIFSLEGMDEGFKNKVLEEKLRRDHGIELPEFEGSVEDYIEKVSSLKPNKIPTWRVRRFVTFGFFPSASMAMYNDIQYDNHDFEGNDAVKSLLLGSEEKNDDGMISDGFAPDHPVDNPEIEKKVPYLVMDADSSQFSTLVDIANNKNMAIEGPPGTGKSQTIVNAIVSAIISGKKVLFIAQKLPALEVVVSRIKSLGLDDFILPLQDVRTSRAKLVENIKSRIELSFGDNSTSHITGEKKALYKKIRDEINEYIEVISKKFRNGYTVHDILGKSIRLANFLDKAPHSLQRPEINNLSRYDERAIKELKEKCIKFKEVYKECKTISDIWKNVNIPSINKFLIDEIINNTSRLSNEFKTKADLQNKIKNYGLEEVDFEELINLKQLSEKLLQKKNNINKELVLDLVKEDNLENFKEILEINKEKVVSSDALNTLFYNNIDENLLKKIDELLSKTKNINLDSFASDYLDGLLEGNEKIKNELEVFKTRNETFFHSIPSLKNSMLSSISEARVIINLFDSEVLALRDDIYDDPSILVLLNRIETSIEKINKEYLNLSHQFNMDLVPTSQELDKHVLTLKSAGILSAFSNDYKQAKQLFGLIVKRNRFTSTYAIKFFSQLSILKKEEEDILSDQKFKDLCGNYFEGLKTNLDPIKKIINFYSQINEKITGIENQYLIDFLKKSPFNLLSSIPSDLNQLEIWDSDDKGKKTLIEKFNSFTSIENKLLEHETSSKQSEEDVNNIKVISKFIKDTNEVLPSNLDDIKDKISNLIQSEELIINHKAYGLLNKYSLNNSEKSFDFSNDIDFTTTLISSKEYKHMLVDVFNNDDFKNFINIISEFNTNNLNIKNISKDILSKTNLSDSDLIPENLNLDELSKRLDEASRDRDGITKHNELKLQKLFFEEEVLDNYLDDLINSNSGLENLELIFESMIIRALALEIYEEFGRGLTKFSGKTLDELRSKLSELDKDIILSNRDEIKNLLIENSNPPSGLGIGRVSSYTEMSFLRHETGKKGGYKSPRVIIDKASKALRELKPCWMMPPLSVAKYLKPGQEQFDLCIIDEASQMLPGSALGGLLRSHQSVVVGDTNQMPPETTFMSSNNDDDEDEDLSIPDESILEMASKVYRPPRRLKWHYRSRNSQLIAFSNKMVYGNELIVFPSANENNKDMGVSLKDVEGTYEGSLNVKEAEQIVNFAIKFMKKYYKRRSLGIVAMNVKQMDLISDKLNQAIQTNEEGKKYKEYWENFNEGLEELFVRNLASVQGDERDVILISTVYGPQIKGGPVAQRFGPINGITGKRRLNVLFSRAKERIITFTSLKPTDIQADETKNPGKYMFQKWIEYSKTGIIEAGIHTHKEPDSDFEIFVIDKIKEMGFEAIPQVGVAGYFIDIGVKHPDWKYGFVLGVECDGKQYHSSNSARDRDRLRQEVLEGLGWSFHRIWSTDWFDNPNKETERLKTKIEDRVKELQSLKSSPEDQFVNNKENDVTEKVVNDLFTTKPELIDEPLVIQNEIKSVNITDTSDEVEIGDQVRVKYLDGNKDGISDEILVKLSSNRSDPDNGIIGVQTSLGRAIYGCEKNEVVDFLSGAYIRKVKILDITKNYN